MDKPKFFFVYAEKDECVEEVRDYFFNKYREVKEKFPEIEWPEIIARDVTNPASIQRVLDRPGKVVVIGKEPVELFPEEVARTVFETDGIKITTCGKYYMHVAVDPKFAKDPQAYMDFLKTLAEDEASFHGERIAEYHVKEDGGHKIGLKERRILARKKYAQRVAFDVLVPFGFAYDAVATGADYQYVKEQLLKYGTFLLLRKYIWAFLGVELSEETTEEILHMNGRIY